jgi:hypothetical protein
MKKIAILFSIFSLLISPLTSFALDYLIGAKAWYASWEPGIKGIGEKFEDTGLQHLETGSGWMYGPNMSILFTDNLSLSISYLYGNLYSKYEKVWEYTDFIGDPYRKDFNGNATTTRQDLDVAVSYRVTQLLRIFAGYKYQPVEISTTASGTVWPLNPADDNFQKEDATFELLFHGPALGAGASLPFGGIFAFTMNLSILYISGDGTLKVDKEVYFISSFRNPTTDSVKVDVTYNGFGLNAEPALICIIKENIIVILGFRYQFIRLDGEFEIKTLGDFPLDDMDDHLYGGYLSILYKF